MSLEELLCEQIDLEWAWISGIVGQH